MDLPKKIVGENYILVYSVPRTSLLRKAVSYFASKFNLKVVSIDKMLTGMNSVDIQIRTAGPEDFIRLFSEASFVITDSFHGTCFSVNFEKPFVCIPATDKANRQEGLLSSLGLLDRIVYSEDRFDSISRQIDYSNASKRLNNLRQDSLSILERSINL